MKLIKSVLIIFLLVASGCLAQDDAGSSALPAIPLCGRIDASDSVTLTPTIIPNLKAVGFVLTWSNEANTLQMDLTSPKGRRLDSSARPPVVYDSKPTKISYLVPDPEPGTWTISLKAKDLANDREGYCLVLDLLPIESSDELQAE
jgi:hypothetical protein